MIVPHSRVKNVDGVKGKTGICLFWECENETRGTRTEVCCFALRNIGARPHPLLLSEIVLKFSKSAFCGLYFGQR